MSGTAVEGASIEAASPETRKTQSRGFSLHHVARARVAERRRRGTEKDLTCA